MLPQVRQIWIFSIAACSAEVSGAITSSRFLMRNSAARRAERGPSPGRRASSWIRRSISGPAMAGIYVFRHSGRARSARAGIHNHDLILSRTAGSYGSRLALAIGAVTRVLDALWLAWP